MLRRLFKRQAQPPQPPYAPYASWHEWDMWHARPPFGTQEYTALMEMLAKEDMERLLRGEHPAANHATERRRRGE